MFAQKKDNKTILSNFHIIRSLPRKLGSGELVCKVHLLQEFMFEYASPCKLRSVYLKIYSGVLEPESVQFSPILGEIQP